MLKNNPFLTVFLLFCVEVLLFKYLDYIDFVPQLDEDFVLAFFCFLIPAVSIILNFFIVESAYKRPFKYFTIFITVVSVLVFGALCYLSALGKAYQH